MGFLSKSSKLCCSVNVYIAINSSVMQIVLSVGEFVDKLALIGELAYVKDELFVALTKPGVPFPVSFLCLDKCSAESYSFFMLEFYSSST